MAVDGRNTQLDGLRGYAAIAVVIFHSILGRDPTQNLRIVRPTLQHVHGAYDLFTKVIFMIFSGETAVVLFFVLSGAVLFESLRHRNAPPGVTAVGFLIRRLLRLYPTFFVCLAACLGALALTGAFAFNAEYFWANAALYNFSILGVSWTLQVELLAIPFVLIGFWSYQRLGIGGIILAYAVFSLVLCEPWLQSHLVYYQRFLFCFALGFLVPTAVGAKVAERLPSFAAPLVLIAMLSVRSILGLHWWSMNAEQIFAALLVTLLYYKRAAGLGRFFDWNISQYLGRLSYSLYLFSVVYLILVNHWTSGLPRFQNHPLEWGILLAVPIVAATILTAHFTELGLERPSIALGRRLTARLSG